MNNRMVGQCSVGLMALLLCIPNSLALGQVWVKDMFVETDHDFGTVPRGAAASYAFKLVNKYEEDVHISGVRSSCGCTLPRIGKAVLKTYEEGTIICEFNSSSFIGSKSAVVTVTFNKPFQGEIQLTVKGNIRSDINTDPGIVEFDKVDLGTSKESVVKVSYQGTKDWKIEDVRSANQHLGVRMEQQNVGNRVQYLLKVVLKDTAPAGDFSDQIVLVTNEQQFNLVTIPVRGQVLPPVSLPETVDLGTIQKGGTLANRIVVRSKDEVEITGVDCSDARFTFNVPAGAKKVHVIPFEFAAGDTLGGFRQRVTVKTSLPDGTTASTLISGNVAD